jgi:gluconokinase
MSDRQLRVVIVLGVEGSGKTTIGKLLAQTLGWKFEDADDYHSAEAKTKMASGIALTDEDRQPWLDALRELVAHRLKDGPPTVLACSALKRSYRDILTVDPTHQAFVYLRGDPELIRERLRKRSGHYAGVSLLDSQFAALEAPRDALSVDIAGAPGQIVAVIRSGLGL